jgi:hypothetical protein
MKKIIYSLLVLGTLIPSLSQAKAMMVYRDQDTVNKAANVYKAADQDFIYKGATVYKAADGEAGEMALNGNTVYKAADEEKAADAETVVSVWRGANGETVVRDGDKEIVIRSITE